MRPPDPFLRYAAPLIVAVATAVTALAAGCHPTGSGVLDAVYTAAVALAFVLAAGLAPRGVVLLVAAVATVMSRGWFLAPGAVALIGGFAAMVPRRQRPWAGSLIGAVEIQLILRWPPVGFQGLTAIVAAALILTVLVTGLGRLGGRQARFLRWSAVSAVVVGVVLAVPAVVGVLVAKPSLERGAAAAHSALSALQSDQINTARLQLGQAELDFGRGYARAGAWWATGSDLIPILAQQHRAVIDLTAAGRALARTGVKDAGGIDFHRLKGTTGGIDLSAIEALQGPLDGLRSQLAATSATVQRVRSGWLVPQISSPLARLQSQLAKEGGTVDLADQAAHQVPSLLGADGPRRYLVAFMTPAETRGLGGFLGAFAELSAVDGKITVVRTGLPKDLVNPSQAPHLEGPASYVARYGPFDPQLHPEDVTYSPDFPSVAQVLTDLYPQVGGDRVDGVLILDPDSLAALLNFTGPISVPGFPDQLDAANAADMLLRQQYILQSLGGQTARLNLLRDTMTVGFKRLLSAHLPSPRQLADTLGPEVRQGRLLFWTTDSRYHPLLDRLGVDGAFPAVPPHGGLSAVTLANAANDKLDAYLEEGTVQHLTYDPATGAVSEDLSVTLANGGSSSLPQFVAGSYVGSGLPAGTNLTWLSVYSPWVLTGATLDGRPLSVEPGVPELGVTAHSTFVRIPPGATSHVEFHFAGRIRPGASLSMVERLQPLAEPSTTQVTVSAAPGSGWAVSPSTPISWTAGPDEVQEHSWHFDRSTKSA